jgi:hypothetical protein
MDGNRSEIDIEEVRNLSGAERTERFKAWNAKVKAFDATTSMRTTRWPLVNEDVTLEQHADIPPATPGGTRTPVLWLKFRRGGARELVVGRGYLDHDGGDWTARLNSVEDGDLRGRVVPSEWASTVPGERPWEGPIIARHNGDPW